MRSCRWSVPLARCDHPHGDLFLNGDWPHHRLPSNADPSEFSGASSGAFQSAGAWFHGDPHSPRDSLFHAHFGWIYDGINPQPEIYGKWLLKDTMALFFQRTFLLWVALGFVVPYLLDGWRGLLWGGLVRMFLSHHITFSVNSICHTFGQRPFDTGDRSTNQWLVGVLALGEGWHNNHHAFPRSAVHGLRWWQIDLSAYVIMILEWLGLVWHVQRISPAAQAARLAKPRLAESAATGRRLPGTVRRAHARRSGSQQRKGTR